MSTSPFHEGRDVLIEVLHVGSYEDTFICAVNGRVPVSALVEIEGQLREEEFEKGHGLYLFEACYFSGQYGEFGMCEIAPGWELTLIEFNADWMAPIEGVQP